MNSFIGVKNSASKVIAGFQMGQIDKDSLYSKGVELANKLNELAANQDVDQDYDEACALVEVIKHFSTC